MLGQYDFFTQVIEINNEALDFNKEDVLRIINAKNPLSLKDKELKLYKTYIHELVHFFDCNSTLWGLEFTGRMYRYFEDPESEQAFEVISLNDSEIAMHNLLKYKKSETNKINFDTIKYSLNYSHQLGPHVVFSYLKFTNGKMEPAHQVVLSMLSLLEGHAYCHEQLFALRAYEHQNDIVSENLLRLEVEELVKDPNNTEYTCIIAFVLQLFPNLPFKNALELVIALSKIVLNAPMLMKSGVPAFLIQKVFGKSDVKLVSSMTMDLARGMNRSTLFLILLMYLAYYDDVHDFPQGENFINDVETLIFELFKLDFNQEDIKNSMFTFWDIEYEHLSKYLEDKGALLTHITATQMRNKPWYSIEPNKIDVPQFYITDCELITPSNNLRVNVDKHCNDILENALALENRLKNDPPQKQHLPPYAAHDWLADLRAGRTGGNFYPY